MKPLKNLLTILLILLPLSAHAWGVVVTSGGVAAAGGGGTCSTQTTVTILGTNDDHCESMYDEGYTVGQSFKATESVTLYSIIVRLDTKPGTNPTLIARIGTSGDLSSSYTATDAHVVTEAAGSEVELVFPSAGRPTITSGNTYYVAIANTGAYAARCELSIDVATAYSDGAYYHDNHGYDWVLDTTYNADLYLKYKKCD